LPYKDHRLALTAGEEQHVAGTVQPLQGQPEWKRRALYTAIEVPACPVQADIAVYEALLLHSLVVSEAGAEQVPAYPLTTRGTPLEEAMHAELMQSWEAHHRLLMPQGVKPDTQELIQEMQVWAEIITSR
jgi:hypothetical protein